MLAGDQDQTYRKGGKKLYKCIYVSPYLEKKSTLGEGQNCPVQSIGGVKALFSYVNILLRGKTTQYYHLGGNAPMPPAGTFLFPRYAP